ncbi:hypothetical protein H9L05_13300 [Hymenobacter qilianensis]|uniref:Thiamine pyrophosphate enzyme TPP-binding domain-containing protein n=2 Tax=Hymenobacter qilianensis TaxID=1385715 RepID=A0A7H0H0P0_9BACT|nr:hypothetical protein H9L05_13300 [Hymenobacter qilianensis]
MEPTAFFDQLLPLDKQPFITSELTAAKANSLTSVADATRVAPPPVPLGIPMQANTSEGEDAGAADASYASRWQRAEQWANGFLAGFFAAPNQPFNEFTVFYRTLQLLPEGTALHLANSMAVRYANILGLANRTAEVFANRGTSGIDGCTSTAVGAALAQPTRPVVLLTGDVAFFYDRNALWHNYPLPNLRIVLFNNHAGGIFRLIDGPRQQPELEELFETHQALSAENTSRDFGLRYFPVSTFAELESALPVFFAPEGGAALLEITTDSATNAAFFEHYRTSVRTSFS